MKLFSKIVILLAAGFMMSCGNINDRIEAIEADKQTQIDSLKKQVLENQQQIKNILLLIKNISALDIPFFIDMTRDEVREFWSTKVSIVYFHEGKYDDTNQDFFNINFGRSGIPNFSATFTNGKCNFHTSRINFEDISIMQAKLKKAGYNLYKDESVWKLPGGDHQWSIRQSGNFYFIDCKKL